MKITIIMLMAFAAIGITGLVGCRKTIVEETTIVQTKRTSGPLSDPDTKWSNEDYK